MKNPTFLRKKDEWLDRIAKDNTEIRLLAREGSVEIMKQDIAKNSTFYLDSGKDWQGFEFIYLLEGNLEYTSRDPALELTPGDYICRDQVPEKSWFLAKTDVSVLYFSTQPSFHLLREEINDFLQVADEIESAEHMKGHSQRLARMSYHVGQKLGLPSERLFDLGYASYFHDLGKVKVSDSILQKHGELDSQEWEIMKKHPIWGREMLEGQELLNRPGKIVGQTHEKIDGTGYPYGLEGEEILLEAKIIAVVDAWDAMRTDRPYRQALGREEAIRELRENVGSQFDQRVLGAFLDVLEEKREAFGPGAPGQQELEWG